MHFFDVGGDDMDLILQAFLCSDPGCTCAPAAVKFKKDIIAQMVSCLGVRIDTHKWRALADAFPELVAEAEKEASKGFVKVTFDSGPEPRYQVRYDGHEDSDDNWFDEEGEDAETAALNYCKGCKEGGTFEEEMTVLVRDKQFPLAPREAFLIENRWEVTRLNLPQP